MRVKHLFFGFALGTAACFSAQAAEESPAVVKLWTIDTQVNPDGLYTRTEHYEIQASNAAASMRIGQQSLPFNESMEDLEVIEAYTAKAGGEKIPVGPNAIYTQQAQGSAQFPQFNDRRQKVIVFPNVGPGDTVAYTARWHAKKAVIPGQFTSNSVFPRGIAYQEVRETIIAPRTFPLQVENHEVAFEKQESGDNVAYRWHYSAPNPSLEDPPAVSRFASLPRFSVSSFRDYDQFARTYANIAASKETITPRIQRVADEAAPGIADRRSRACSRTQP